MTWPVWVVIGVVSVTVGLFLLIGIRVVYQTERGLKERFGRYVHFCLPGFHWVIPLVETVRRVNVTEQMVNAEKREIITKDKLNAVVDAQVYFRVNASEDDVKASQYAVESYDSQIVALAQTTLRNIVGNLTLTEANSDRQVINAALATQLTKETSNWGLVIVRTELKEIDPPTDVQESMNRVVKAENEKVAAKDFAVAQETKADGERMATIKIAEGAKQSVILKAEGDAEAIRLVNEAAQRYFIGNAVELRRLEAVERALAHGTKIVVPATGHLVNVIGGLMNAQEGA